MYSKRYFLNDKDSPSTGSIVVYDGPDPWEKDENFTFLELSDCHVKVRLHQTKLDTKEQFIKKLKIIQAVVDSFIFYLERRET